MNIQVITENIADTMRERDKIPTIVYDEVNKGRTCYN